MFNYSHLERNHLVFSAKFLLYSTKRSVSVTKVSNYLATADSHHLRSWDFVDTIIIDSSQCTHRFGKKLQQRNALESSQRREYKK